MSLSRLIRRLRPGAVLLLVASPLYLGTATSQASGGAPSGRHTVTSQSSGGGEASAGEQLNAENNEELAVELEGEEEGPAGSERGSEGGGETGESRSPDEEVELELEEEEGAGTATNSARGSRGGHAVSLSGLHLSHSTTAALAHGGLRASGISFTFRLSGRDHVRVSLERGARSGGHVHWALLSGPLDVSGVRGANHDHLHAGFRLQPGAYRVIVTPVSGRAQSLELHVK